MENAFPDIVANDERVLVWLSDDELAAVPTSTFWNDEETEKAKAYYVVEGDPEKLLAYLRDSTYLEQYEAVVRFAGEIGHPVKGIGVDLAAGVAWTTALLSRLPAVERIVAVEISRHRILKLAPVVTQVLDGDAAKIVRAVGSFYDIKVPDRSVDFCMMSQAFHHADAPHGLLREARRVLKPGGVVLVIGEGTISAGQVLVKRVKNVVKMMLPASLYGGPPVYKVWPSFQELFPPDLEGGDHYYRDGDYRTMFADAGFDLYALRHRRYTVFVAIRKG